MDEYLRAFAAAAGYTVTTVVRAACADCSGSEFSVLLDDETGVAVRRCVGCGAGVAMLDSEDHLEDAELGTATCPCGNVTVEVAVGFAEDEDGEVRWVSVGLRCRRDGRLGVYVDWEVDYSRSRHLLDAV